MTSPPTPAEFFEYVVIGFAVIVVGAMLASFAIPVIAALHDDMLDHLQTWLKLRKEQRRLKVIQGIKRDEP